MCRVLSAFWPQETFLAGLPDADKKQAPNYNAARPVNRNPNSMMLRHAKNALNAAVLAALLTACTQTPESTGSPIDLIVAGDLVVTMDEQNSVIAGGAVAIDDGRIVAIGPYPQIAAEYSAQETLAGEERVVMPGLINAHTHAAMSLLRGIADDLTLEAWLMDYIFPTEVRFVDADFVRIGTELACWEMIRGGTTTFVDMYYFPDAVAEAVESCGVRALIAPTIIDQKSPDAENGQESLEKAVSFVERWQGRNNRVIPIISAHSVYTVGPELLVKIRAAGEALGIPIGIHMSETPAELETSQQRYGENADPAPGRPWFLRRRHHRCPCSLAVGGGNFDPRRTSRRRGT